jgi:hypothetical protein
LSSKKPIVRLYRGNQKDTMSAFKKDAALMAKKGYYPISQNYQPGSWDSFAFFFALLLCIVIIGILVFLYMLIVKPDGTLSVTYEHRAEATIEEEKLCPQCAEKVKKAAKICRYCNHQFYK